MKISMRLVEDVREKLDHLSKSERQIAQLLLEDPALFASSSLGKVAENVGVSQPTVVRFCRHIGFDGFKDFKMQLAQNLAVEQAFRDSPSANLTEAAAGSLLDPLRQGVINLIDQTVANLDMDKFGEAVNIIARCNRMMVYGLGGSSAAIAQEAQNRFCRLGINSWAYSDSYMQRMTAATVTEEDVVLIISSTGKPRALLDCVELAQHYNCKTIAIAPDNSALGGSSDLCLSIPLEQVKVPYYQPSPVRYAQLFVLDSLAYKVAVKMGDRSKESLKRIRSTVTSVHGLVPSQPIGD